MKKHPKKCDCWVCAGRFLRQYERKVKQEYMVPPKDKDHTVFVRAHFRKVKGHLKNKPHHRKAAQGFLAAFIRGLTQEAA